MPKKTSLTGSELFIVDNSEDDWKAVRYLRDWCQISKSMDIATGYFEIGSLLALGEEWQKVDSFRILMGDEVSRRTKKAFEESMSRIVGQLDQSIEIEKKKNDFLDGVAAIVAALRSGKIQCRVYRKEKFHAKAYITHARMEVIGSSALVGSSNFTHPGLTQNIELNVQITGAPVAVLQEWYEQHWDEAEDVTPELLRTIEKHIEDYSPFDVYVKALHEYFKGHEQTATEWERDHSAIYKILAPYQQEGYHALLKRANRYKGAFLCDGVGLGKTYVGLMLIERLIVHDRLKVALFVPKSARKPVWERSLRQRLPHLFGKYSQLEIFNHTDLMRGGQTAEDTLHLCINYRPDELYDTLVEELFRRYHPFADQLNICFAKRGNKARTHAFRSAIERAEARFESDFGTRRSAEVAITASTPPQSTGLQAVDYFLWALQRYYERGEDRYIELIWDKVVEVEDLDRVEGGRKGVTYNKKSPLFGIQEASEE